MDVKEADAVIHRIFAGVSGYTTSLNARAAMAEDASRHYTYGEFSTEALAAMLAMAAPQPGEVFYDLGAGSGAGLGAGAGFGARLAPGTGCGGALVPADSA